MKAITSGAGGRKYNQEQSKVQLLDTRADKIKDKVNIQGKKIKIWTKYWHGKCSVCAHSSVISKCSLPVQNVSMSVDPSTPEELC